MNLEILSSVVRIKETEERNDELIIGTHNGIFHVDDVVACAILYLLHFTIPVKILRTRDLNQLSQCDICVDVGGGNFDHHQAGFNKVRKNGCKYASAGLIWKSYGRQLIKLFLDKYFPKINDIAIDAIFESFDNSFISPIDCEDNGIEVAHCFSFISSFLPLWFNNKQTDFDNRFKKALTTTITVLEETLKTTIGKEIAKNIIENNWNSPNYFQHGILEIPSQTIMWQEAVININASTKINKINFVIFPYPNGGWATQCVPPSLQNKFGKRIPFPKKWAGQTDKLPEISGVEGATFCHNGCFFARASTKDSVIQMCNIAFSKSFSLYALLTKAIRALSYILSIPHGES